MLASNFHLLQRLICFPATKENMQLSLICFLATPLLHQADIEFLP